MPELTTAQILEAIKYQDLARGAWRVAQLIQHSPVVWQHYMNKSAHYARVARWIIGIET